VNQTATAVLSLGSNLGDRELNIREAIADIAALPGVTILAASGLVETPALKPHGVDADAPAYLNAVVAIATGAEPAELLGALNRIETGHGRVREVRWGDRTLDIDIVTFADRTQDEPALTLPHPRAHERAFVLVPWLEVDPDATLPGLGRIDGLPAASENVRRYPAEALS
jgi:2-amino-4-hydroxy-6-hydroxymethyldihydropteridine diphosphokinase